MRVVGLISGTSMDGIDAAAIEIERREGRIQFELLECATTPYPDALRAALDAIDPSCAGVTLAQISSLNFALGEAFGGAVLRIQQTVPGVSLVGSHGQTVFHESRPALGSGRVPSTLQLAEPAVIAERSGITTVADFRVRDVAAGGHGAPLVSFVDYLTMRSDAEMRVALNIGGIANVTILPAACAAKDVLAFDTGPGNMLVDLAVRTLYPQASGFDRDGKIAARASIHEPLLGWLLLDPYFSLLAPKTAGREQFGRSFFEGAHAQARKLRCDDADFVATLTELSARTIANSVPSECDRLVVSGGGVHNQTLMRAIDRNVEQHPRRPQIVRAEAFGLPVDAKEAIAFAILAFEAIHGRENTLPNATGAERPVVMGKIIAGENFIPLMRSIWGSSG